MLIALLAIFFLAACSGSSGFPAQPGEYEIKPKSLIWDGREYEFLWVDKGGELRRARGDKIKMVQDSRTFLEVTGADPIIHLASEEPVAVKAEDRDGGFSTFWFPFMMGQALGGGLNRPVVVNQPVPGAPTTPPGTPTYHYPPTDSFGRGDTLQGSLTNSKPSAPKYEGIAPAPNAVSGQSGGTGGGTAASGKSGGIGGQSGGTGTGSAATNKGGFATGNNSYRSNVDAGRVPGRTGAGSSGGQKGKGTSSGVKGGSSSGGLSGGRSSGGLSGGRIGGGKRR